MSGGDAVSGEFYMSGVSCGFFICAGFCARCGGDVIAVATTPPCFRYLGIPSTGSPSWESPSGGMHAA